MRDKYIRANKRMILLLMLLSVLIGGLLYVQSFTIQEVNVAGNEAVSEDMIREAVLAEAPLNNTLLLYIKCKFKPIEDIPFVEKVDIDFLSKNGVDVTVYEKAMAGCVEYMNGYVFFDKDGMILDASSQMIEGVPCIRGLSFNSWEVGEKLPISDKSKFNSILTITQLIEKYDLDISGIKFTASGEIVLTHDNIDIELGGGEDLPIQMMNLGQILDGLGDMSGTLYMKDFTADDGTASFSKKK
ncbi:MAG: hypothetical protein K6A61_02425 [Butyrivibrio sp.]|nr:hypothetical protein [Butyrivibrio sp.]